LIRRINRVSTGWTLLFYKDNTQMLFGDARKMVDAVLAELKQDPLTRSA
jgi:NAD/NADP transhydrogenase beta subunit